MNYYLFTQIFMSSVQQTLVDLFYKQILNIVPITCNYLKFVPESFNRDSLFFTRYFVCVGWYENSHRLMKCKLYAQIFMSSVQQMLLNVFFSIILLSGHNYLEIISTFLTRFQPRPTVFPQYRDCSYAKNSVNSCW